MNFIEFLIAKYNKGLCTPEEVKFLRAYYRLFELREDVLKSMSNEERSKLKDEIRSKIELLKKR